MDAVASACASGVLDADVVCVVSNHPAVGAIDRAERHGIPVEVVPAGGRTRAMYDGVLAHIIESYEPDLVVLAGWMRIVTRSFVTRFPVINIHPALPGAFPGLEAIDRAFDAWQAGEINTSGVMVHWVPDEGVDDGPVVAMREVPFQSDDSRESFEARIHETEHTLLVEAIGLALTELGVNA